MKALSIKQPWAWAILNAGKRVENRSWHTSFRGEILIHASKLRPAKKVPEDFLDDFETVVFTARQAGVELPHITYAKLVVHSGAIVGRARIVDCVSSSDSPWFCGPFGFVLSDIELTPIVPCKGALGLWNLPDEVMRHLDACPRFGVQP